MSVKPTRTVANAALRGCNPWVGYAGRDEGGAEAPPSQANCLLQTLVLAELDLADADVEGLDAVGAALAQDDRDVFLGHRVGGRARTTVTTGERAAHRERSPGGAGRPRVHAEAEVAVGATPTRREHACREVSRGDVDRARGRGDLRCGVPLDDDLAGGRGRAEQGAAVVAGGADRALERRL